MSIVNYLNSLPEDTEEINVSGTGISYLPDLTRFKKLKMLFCNNNNLTSLPVLNETLVTLYCYTNNLTSLPALSENIEYLNCSNNKLTSLPILNKKLKMLFCQHNELTLLPPLNEKIEKVLCQHNRLTSLPILNAKLQMLHCEHNELTSLLPFNKKLQTLFKNNPIYKMINSDNKHIINQKLKVLNRFRFLYYCLKFKKRFRNWLWVKIREPKIREKYSHNYLVANLHEDTDLDELLENW